MRIKKWGRLQGFILSNNLPTVHPKLIILQLFYSSGTFLTSATLYIHLELDSEGLPRTFITCYTIKQLQLIK